MISGGSVAGGRVVLDKFFSLVLGGVSLFTAVHPFHRPHRCYEGDRSLCHEGFLEAKVVLRRGA